jgi:hypothetical protein
MRELLSQLATDLAGIDQADLDLIYDMAYSPPGHGSDQPKVSRTQVDPQLPRGNLPALMGYRAMQQASETATVRLGLLLMLHGEAAPALALGEGPAVLGARISALVDALRTLATHPRLRKDRPMREQLTMNSGAPNVCQCVTTIAGTIQRLLPQPSQAELLAMQARPCSNCGEPAVGNRKRCSACHSYFSRTKQERATHPFTQEVATG